MQQLGPYLVLTEEGMPNDWCYFSINSESRILYYTKSYGDPIDWLETSLLSDNNFYVYDLKTKSPICYKYQNGKFYQIPLQAGNRVSVVKEFKNGAFQLARLRAKDLEIKIESYIELQADLVLEKEPELPLLPAEDVVSSVVYATVDIDTARQDLLVKKLVKINSKEEGVLESGVLFVWEDSDDWYFKTFLLGEEIRGKLDSRLDGLIIAKAQDSSGEIALSELEMQEFSRCYLKLTPAHQANITAIFSHVWPLSVDMSTDEQIAVCRAILNAESLSSAEFSDEDKVLKYNESIEIFCDYLLEAKINAMFQRDYAIAASKNMVYELPRISEVIVYINYLVVAAGRILGDGSLSFIHNSPYIANIRCDHIQVLSQSISQGLSDEQSYLLELIVTVNIDELDALDINELISLNKKLEGIINISESTRELSQVADYAVAMISAESGDDQLTARADLIENCKELQNLIFTNILNKLSLLSLENFKLMCSHILSNADAPESLLDLLQIFNQVNFFIRENVVRNFSAVVRHQNFSEVFLALQILKEVSLLECDNAQANFNAVIRYRNVDVLLYMLIILQETSLLTCDNAQKNFNAVIRSQNLQLVLHILQILKDARLLSGKDVQINFNRVIRHKSLPDIARALRELQEVELFTGEYAQENFNAVVMHESPSDVARALKELQLSGLLLDVNARANFNMVVRHKDPSGVAMALQLLKEVGLFENRGAEERFVALVAHDDPSGVAAALEELSELGLLAREYAEESFFSVVRHKSPYALAKIFKELNKMDAITEDEARENFIAVVNHQDPGLLSRVLQLLNQDGLFLGRNAQENFTALVSDQNPLDYFAKRKSYYHMILAIGSLLVCEGVITTTLAFTILNATTFNSSGLVAATTGGVSLLAGVGVGLFSKTIARGVASKQFDANSFQEELIVIISP